jgi:CheY-like chemotaxis protein
MSASTVTARFGPDEGPRNNPTALQVLLVEDHAVTAQTLAALLGQSGYRVRVAEDGPTALQAAEAEPPDVVLLDLGLPGIDGYEVARRLRARKGLPRPLMIAVTGYGQREECLRSYEVGIDLHLTKPVSISELRRFLENYQSRRLPPGRARDATA